MNSRQNFLYNGAKKTGIDSINQKGGIKMKKSIEEYKKQATLTVEEVADILRVSRSKAYEIVKQGYFPFKKINHTIRIPTEPFFEWLNSYSSDEMITDSPKEETVFDKDIILKNKKIIKEEKVS